MKHILEKIESAKKETIYLISALIFGLLMLIINPPFLGVPDEYVHFWKAWSVAGGYLNCSGHDMTPDSAGALPEALKPLVIKGEKGDKLNVPALRNSFSGKGNNTMVDIKGVSCSATPLGYLPQAAGLKIGKWLGLSPIMDFYLARLANLFVAVLITYFAIRTIPFGKIILLLAALLPMAIQQYASLSYDALAISTAFLFIAYVLKLAYDKDQQMSTKDMAILFVLSFVSLHIKAGYFLLSFLVFLLPLKKFPSKKVYIAVSLSFILANLLLFQIIRNQYLSFDQMPVPDGVNPNQQLEKVIKNPIGFLGVVTHSLEKNREFYYHTAIYMPGWLKVDLSDIFYLLVALVVALLMINENEKINLSRRQRLVLLSVFLACLLFVFLSLYLAWTKVGAKRVAGVQGRYFLPFLPLLISAFYGLGRRFGVFQKTGSYNNLFLLAYLHVCYAYVIFTIVRIYY